MKKSELRNIIRESIRGLLTEQQQSQIIWVAYPNMAPISSNYCAPSQPGGFKWACCHHQQPSNPGTTTIDDVGGASGNANLFNTLGIPVNGTVPCIQNCNTTNMGNTVLTNQQINDLISNYGTMPVYNASSTLPSGNFMGVWDDGNTTQDFGNSLTCNNWVQDNLTTPELTGDFLTPLTPQQQVDISNMQKDTPPTSGGPFSGIKPPVNSPQMKRMKDLAFKGKR